MHDREAAHRATSEYQQRDSGDERRHIRVEDGSPCALVSGLDCGVRGIAPAQLFAYALVDEHVGVDGHPERQRDRGDAGERQRRLQHRKDGDQQQQIDRQRYDRDHAHELVIQNDEEREHDDAVEHRVESLLDVLGGERRADGPLLDDFHGSRKRAGAHEERDVVGLAGVHPPADLNAAASDFLADHRRGDHLGLALLDQYDGHALADVIAGELLEDSRPRAVQVDMHRGLVGPSVETGLCVVDAISRQHHLPPHQYRRAVALGEQITAQRRLSGRRLLERTGLVVDHAYLERRRATQDVLGARGVLHSRQLNDHAIRALLLDDRFCDAELVDAVAQNRDVLSHRAVLNAFLRLRLEARDEPEVVAGVDAVEQQVGERVADFAVGLVALARVAKPDGDILALACDAPVLNLLFAQQRANVSQIAVGSLVQRRLHVDLQEEVDSAAQVEAEIHRQRSDGREPSRRARQQIQGDNVVVAECFLQNVFGLDLRVQIVEADLDTGWIERFASKGDVRRFERLFDFLQRRCIDLDAGPAGGNLDCGNFRKKIRQGVDNAHGQCNADQHIFPKWIAVHLNPSLGVKERFSSDIRVRRLS